MSCRKKLLHPLCRRLKATFRIQAESAPHGDRWLMAILFEKEPLIDLRARVGIGWQQGCLLREVQEDGVGFGEKAVDGKTPSDLLAGFTARGAGVRVRATVQARPMRRAG